MLMDEPKPFNLLPDDLIDQIVVHSVRHIGLVTMVTVVNICDHNNDILIRQYICNLEYCSMYVSSVNPRPFTVFESCYGYLAVYKYNGGRTKIDNVVAQCTPVGNMATFSLFSKVRILQRFFY